MAAAAEAGAHEPTRVAITGIGLVTALGATREETWRRHARGRVRHRARHACSTSAGYRSRIAAEVPIAADRRARSRRSSGAAGRAAIGIGVARRDRSARRLRACSTSAHRPRRGSASSSAPAPPICCATRTSIDTMDRRAGFAARAAVGRRGITSRARRSTSSPRASASKGLRALRRRRLFVEHDRDRPGRRRDPLRPADAALAGGTDALARLTFSGFNALRLMDPAPCRPFDREPRRHEHRRRRGDPGARGARSRARARGATIYAELAGYEPRLRGVSPDGAGARRPAGGRGHRARRCADAGARRRRGRSHQRARHRDAAERRAEARGFRRVFGERVARHSGHVDQVDDRPLPRRRRRGRSGGPRADDRARRHPADHSSRTRPTPSARVDIVANEAREQRVRCGVSTSLGFGGNDSAVVIAAV